MRRAALAIGLALGAAVAWVMIDAAARSSGASVPRSPARRAGLAVLAGLELWLAVMWLAPAVRVAFL